MTLEQVNFDSYINKVQEEESKFLMEAQVKSPVLMEFTSNSPITKEVEYPSPIDLEEI